MASNVVAILQGVLTFVTSASGATTGVIAAVVAAVPVGRKVYHGVKRVSHGLNAVDRLVKEVLPNGGGSLRDTLNRVEVNQSVDRAMLRGIAATSNEPIFQSDNNGLCTWANERWCQLTGMDIADALGEGWINAVHQDDRAKVTGDWLAARQGGRICLYTYRYCNVETGTIVNVTVRTEPIIVNRAVAGWLGTVRINHFE